MTDRELMQMALDALEKLNKDGWILADFEDEVYASIEALRARLAGWERVNMSDHKEGNLGIGNPNQVTLDTSGATTFSNTPIDWDASAPLVVTPHPAFKKPWVELTDEEIDACVHENMTISDLRLRDAVYGVVLSTEAKLKEKNT